MPFEAPHLVQLVLAQLARESRPGDRKTTIDLPLQRRAQAMVASHRVRLQKCGASQAAVVVVDNRTLSVRALAGSYHYGPRQSHGFNNGAAALRSPGSTLKPFLYAQALDLGYTPATVLEDVERRYRTPRGEYHPRQLRPLLPRPGLFPGGPGQLPQPLGRRPAQPRGPPAFYDTLKTLRLINHPERSPDHYGLGLVVGNPEVSLLQLATAYSCLANSGVFRTLRLREDDALDPGLQSFPPRRPISSAISSPIPWPGAGSSAAPWP